MHTHTHTHTHAHTHTHCVLLGQAAEVEVRECEVGGLGLAQAERAWVGVSVWDQANCSISRSSLAQGLESLAALRACDTCRLSVLSCSVDDYGFALSLSHSARVRMVECTVNRVDSTTIYIYSSTILPRPHG